MQRGLLPGTLALSAKFVPAMRAVAAQTVEVCGEGLQSSDARRNTRLRGQDCRPGYPML